MTAAGRNEPKSGEDLLIARYFRPLATDPGAFGLGDDAAILKPSGDEIVVTTDAIVEGVHFLPDDPPDTIARKALRVNLSDLAAKGATPAGFVLTLALRAAEEAWLAPFARGLGEDAALFGCPLLGGDTVSTPGPLMISITAFGRVAPGRMVHRHGAKPGDRVVVTGTIGDAALGLDILRGGAVAADLADDAAAKRKCWSGATGFHSRARRWRRRFAITPVRRWMCRTVWRGISPSYAMRPASPPPSTRRASLCRLRAAKLLARRIVGIEAIVAGGDDYEILCTIPENRFEAFARDARLAAVAVTSIGTIIAGTSAPRFLDAEGQEIALPRLSYSHFQDFGV